MRFWKWQGRKRLHRIHIGVAEIFDGLVTVLTLGQFGSSTSFYVTVHYEKKYLKKRLDAQKSNV